MPSVTADDMLPTAYYSADSALSYRGSVPLVNLPTYNYTRMPPIFWTYFNGLRLFASPRIQDNEFIEVPADLQVNFSITSQSEAVITLFIPRVQTGFKGGMYEMAFLIETNQAKLNCCESYNRLFTDSEGIDLQYFVVGLAAVPIEQASKI